MHIQKTHKEGSSTVVVIPRVYCRELGIEPGDYITIRPDHDGHLIMGRMEEYLRDRDKTRTRPSRPGR